MPGIQRVDARNSLSFGGNVDIHGHTSSSQTEYADERTFPGLLNDIAASIRRMVRSEIMLAKTEVTETARRARSAAILFATGTVLAVFAVGFLLLTDMLRLEIIVPAWLSALIVGMLLMIA